MTAASGFDPAPHLRRLRGRGGDQDYLDVKWRLVWFRDRFPDGLIETELVQLGDAAAVFKATVTAVAAGEVRGRATGYGSETKGDFGDFIEKAETKAVGRALAALGFGAQFVGDGDERPVDAATDGAEADWRAAIEGAATLGDLERIGREMKAAKVESNELRAAYKLRSAVFLQAGG